MVEYYSAIKKAACDMLREKCQLCYIAYVFLLLKDV